jgi:hypothetical protein
MSLALGFEVKQRKLLSTAHEKHACLNQNWKYAYFTRVKYELSSADEKPASKPGLSMFFLVQKPG